MGPLKFLGSNHVSEWDISDQTVMDSFFASLMNENNLERITHYNYAMLLTALLPCVLHVGTDVKTMCPLGGTLLVQTCTLLRPSWRPLPV